MKLSTDCCSTHTTLGSAEEKAALVVAGTAAGPDSGIGDWLCSRKSVALFARSHVAAPDSCISAR